jgi:hypothetical protein
MRALRDTQPLPVVETIEDLHREDPEGVFAHRRVDMDAVSWTDHGQRYSVPYRPSTQWGQAALDRLIKDIKGVRA